ncbi:sigma-70 family RNA polymerase sigma factor [Aeromicrobium sp. A1-2]|uniref:sigma-70 family RNA polymerase sigma factor n=1 Tax=Aeromicrobium sp. A1-2 TaxID=2107713 RepID=UPI0013C2CFE6|nr:sigma-70 family RNA polymerase sigma factor [Aeromicrobium sp. A1-2]
MPEAVTPLAERDDVELLSMARIDDQEAFAVLFARYEYPALRLARHLGQGDEADDVVAESFTQVLDLVRRGKGPDRAFRAYLFTTIRHEAGRRAKARQRVVPTDDETQIDTAVKFGAGQLDEFEKSAIRAAYESLPSRWRTVLWHLDVEGRKPQELGPLLSMSANSVSALVYRARSGLREAYLQQHIKSDDTAGRTCRAVRSKLSGFVRRTASGREQEKIHGHLESCPRCMAIYLDLQEVNREVGAIIAPASLAVSVSGGVALVVVGLAVGAGGMAALLTHLAVVGKAAAMAVAPTVAAAALTTATVIGVAAPVVNPPRIPFGSQGPGSLTDPQVARADAPHDSARSVDAREEHPARAAALEATPTPESAATDEDGTPGPAENEAPPVASMTRRDSPKSQVREPISGAAGLLASLGTGRPDGSTPQGLTDAGTSVVDTVKGAAGDLPIVVTP